jgi:putative transposase
MGDWFKNRRSLDPISNAAPDEAEERFCDLLDDVPMAA